MTITEFLEVRITEDEALAEAAAISTHGERHTKRWDYTSYVLAADRDSTAAQDEFITEFWPARVLAECAAKRAISEAHTVITVWPEGTGGSKYYTGSKQVCASCDERTETPCPTARALAAVYSDHPDYQQEWAQ